MPLSQSPKNSSKKPMTDTQLTQWAASRDLEAELTKSVRQWMRGLGNVAHPQIIVSRHNPRPCAS